MIKPSEESERNDRQRRSQWPVRVGRLAEMEADEPNLSLSTTVEQRWAMMWQLTKDAWAFRGEPIPDPSVLRTVGQLIRRGQ